MTNVEAVIVRLRMHARQGLLLVVSRRSVIHEIRGRSAFVPVDVVHGHRYVYVKISALIKTCDVIDVWLCRSPPRLDQVMIEVSSIYPLAEKQNSTSTGRLGGHNMVVQTSALPGIFGNQAPRSPGSVKAVWACARGTGFQLLLCARRSDAEDNNAS